MSQPDHIWITCHNNTCNKRFTSEYFSSGLKTAPVADEDRGHQIYEGIISTRLFCMNCAHNHAKIICRLSRIQWE